MKKGRNCFLICFLLIVCLLVGNIGFTSVQAKSISLNKGKTKSISLYVGKSVTVKASGGSKSIAWKSQNNKIATVNKKGKVTGKKPGTTKIVGTDKKTSKKYVCKIKVGNYITGLSITSANTVILDIGATSTIKATVKGSKVLDAGISYKSADSSIVSVNSKGKLTGVAPGMTTVSLRTKGVNKKGNTYSGKITVVVNEDIASESLIPQTTPIVAPSSDVKVVAVENGSTSQPASGTAVATAAPSSSPQSDTGRTLQEVIQGIETPSDDQVQAATIVVEEAGAMKTLYFINRSYTGNIGLYVFGYPFSSNRKVSSVLKQIVSFNDMATYISSGGERVLLAADKRGECTIKNLATEEVIHFMVYEQDPFYGTTYGLIIAEGDTRDKIVIK